MVLMRTTIPTVPMMATVVKTTVVSTNVFNTERLLQQGHLEEDCLIPTISENIRLSSFLANGPTTTTTTSLFSITIFVQVLPTNKIQGLTSQPLQSLKPFELSWPFSKQFSKLMNIQERPACLKSWESFFSEIVVIGQSSSKCSGSISRTREIKIHV